MRTAGVLSIVAALALGPALLDARDARAAGGLFVTPTDPGPPDAGLVSSHRIAVALTATETILWDQVRDESAAGGDFAWVLPVRAGARLELSNDAWFDALEASTQPVVVAPARMCPVYTSSGGCNSQTTMSMQPVSDGGSDAVRIVSEAVVGPYDAVTVRASQGEALSDWFKGNGYVLPSSLGASIDLYAAEGFDFIALRIHSPQGVGAIQPVRVVTPGMDLTLPLRFASAGIGPHVPIELFVFGAGRFHPANAVDVTLDSSFLEWQPSGSNYDSVAEVALGNGTGAGWLTEYAEPVGTVVDGGTNSQLGAIYDRLCAPLLGQALACGDDAGGDGAAATDAGAGTDADASSSDAASDGGAVGPSVGVPTCVPAALCDDLTVATGGDAGAFWLTRLRADLPASAFASDLVLEAAPTQQPVSSVIQGSNDVSCPCDSCGDCSVAAAAPPLRWSVGHSTALSLGGLLLGWALRRQAARSRRTS